MAHNTLPSARRSHRKRIFWIALAAVFAISLLALLGAELFSERGEALTIGQSPPDFILHTYMGNDIQTAALRGQVVLINFWSSWCTTCDEEAQMLQEAWSVYQSQGESVFFIGVAYMDTKPDALAFLDTYGVTYVNGPDLRGEISHLYQLSSVPETYILDGKGVLRAVKIGPFTSTEEIFNAISDAALSE